MSQSNSRHSQSGAPTSKLIENVEASLERVNQTLYSMDSHVQELSKKGWTVVLKAEETSVGFMRVVGTVERRLTPALDGPVSAAPVAVGFNPQDPSKN